MSGDDPRDELERAAGQHRAREAARAGLEREAEETPAARAQREQRARRELADEALAEAGGLGTAMYYVTIAVCMFAPAALIAIVWGLESFLALMAASVGGVALALGSISVYVAAAAWWRRRRLRAIGHGLDVDAYLAQLGENRRTSAVVVRVAFARPWPPDAKASALDAVLAWMPSLDRAEWGADDDTLRLYSRELDTTKWLGSSKYGSDRRFFGNEPVHACVARVLRTVVPRLHAVTPIARIDIQIDGKVEPFDARP